MAAYAVSEFWVNRVLPDSSYKKTRTSASLKFGVLDELLALKTDHPGLIFLALDKYALYCDSCHYHFSSIHHTVALQYLALRHSKSTKNKNQNLPTLKRMAISFKRAGARARESTCFALKSEWHSRTASGPMS